MQACLKAGIKRLVYTSSTAAITRGPGAPNGLYTSESWSNVKYCTRPYEKGKTLAERFAWDFVKKLPKDKKFELVTICPSWIIGPHVHNRKYESATVW